MKEPWLTTISFATQAACDTFVEKLEKEGYEESTDLKLPGAFETKAEGDEVVVRIQPISPKNKQSLYTWAHDARERHSEPKRSTGPKRVASQKKRAPKVTHKRRVTVKTKRTKPSLSSLTTLIAHYEKLRDRYQRVVDQLRKVANEAGEL